MKNLLRPFRFPADLAPDLRSNFTHLYWDISWWGLYMGATVAFLTIYAARIGATPEQIGWMTAAPAALSLLMALPTGRLIRKVLPTTATIWSALGGRMLFLSYALLPFFFNEKGQVWAILVIALLLSVPNTVIGISYAQFFMDAIPLEWRRTVVGVRGALLAIISFAVTLACGQILTAMAFPGGYQVVFVIGFLGGIATVYHITRIKKVVRAAAPPGAEVYLPGENSLEAADRTAADRRAFDRHAATQYYKVIGLLFLLNAANNMVAPVIPGLLVNTLKLSDGMIGIGTATSSMLAFLSSLVMARASHRLNNQVGTALGAGLLAVQAVLLALATGPVLYLLAAVLGGTASGLLMTASYNYHLDNVPDGDRSVWLSRGLLLGNAAVLLGALGGPLVARFVALPLALAIFGGLRLLTGLIILRWGGRKAYNQAIQTPSEVIP